MMLKTYQAGTMAEAIAEVKRDLGRDAVILHTRSFRKGGLMGLGGRSVWEVTASPNDINVPQRVRGKYVSQRPADEAVGADESADLLSELTGRAAIEIPGAQPPLAGQGWIDPELRQSIWRQQVGLDRVPRKGRDEVVADAPVAPAEPRMTPTAQTPTAAAAPSPLEVELSREVSSLRQMMETLLQSHLSAPTVTASPAATPAKDASVEGELKGFYDLLLRQDVEEGIALELMSQLKLSLSGTTQYDAKVVADRLCDLIASRIPTSEPTPPTPRSPNQRPRVIALVGPTGVGKTTTIAKLAASYKLQHHLRVGLVTIDTYRIAAVDQLKTYAEIIEVPIRTVMSAEELHRAIYGMPNVDVVLIDTAGRSQNDRPRLNQLKAYIAAADADEVHMVVSAGASRKAIMNALTQFGPLGANRILLTKLDEAESLGTILSMAAGGGSPLSYLTTGQDVPDDIEVADSWRLAQRILKG